MQPNVFAAQEKIPSNDDLKIFIFGNPAGTNLCFSNASNNCHLEYPSDSRHAYRRFPNDKSEFCFQGIKKHFTSAK